MSRRPPNDPSELQQTEPDRTSHSVPPSSNRNLFTSTDSLSVPEPGEPLVPILSALKPRYVIPPVDSVDVSRLIDPAIAETNLQVHCQLAHVANLHQNGKLRLSHEQLNYLEDLKRQIKWHEPSTLRI
jgi:hypothetical protein